MASAKQGEVFLADVAPRIGFDTDRVAARQLVVVVQGNALNDVLESVLVVPLVRSVRGVPRFALDVPVAGAEIGEAHDHVAPAHLLRPIAVSRFAPVPVASVSGTTLARLLAAVRRVFQ